MTGDGRNDRLTEQHTRRPHRPITIRGELIALRLGGDRLQVRPRAERAEFTVQDGNIAVGVGVKIPERISQRASGRTIDRIAHLRTRQAHNSNAITNIHPY